MRNLSRSFVYVIVLFAVFFSNAMYAQMVGDQVFLPGHWVEAGIAPNGSLGSTRLPPAGYHCNSPSFTFWDPALAASNTSNQRLMMVYDSEHDGWTTGTVLPFFGDYSMPGTPYEGWGIQVNGVHSEAHAEYYLSTTSGFLGGTLTGTNISYSNPLGSLIGVWQGTAGGLQITQTTRLDTNASWLNFKVVIKNPTLSPIANVYYLRETDPDNDELVPFGFHGVFGTCGGQFTTTNTIDHQNDYAHRVQVTGRATCITDQTLSLSAKDCRAKCFIQPGWPMSTATNLASLWSGSGGVTMSGTSVGDYAIGLVFNLGTIAPGDSTILNYAYVFNGLLGMDSALANPQIFVNGTLHDSVDTVTACAFASDTLFVNILNGSTADWAGSTWTWAPSTYLTATTGTSSGVLASTMTSYVTYTITGTTAVGGCSGKTFLLTVMPPGATPLPTTTTPLSYCLGSIAPPLTASGIGTIYWWTTPTGGVGSTTAPTPSTAAVGTTTYYVSQVVAGCSSARVAVTVTIFALSTPITGSLFACTGFTTTLSNASAGGTWISGSPLIASVGSSSGVVNGLAPGTSTISYLVSGCVATVIVTVTNTPGSITGVLIACLGSTTNLSNSVAGGSWQSSNGLIASVGSSTGVVTGNSLGTAIITYNMGGGCISTAVVTVNPYPGAITGSFSLCTGTSTTLSSGTGGGIWTSSTPSIATVGVVSGVVTSGATLGTTTISYRVAGCAVTQVVTVVNTPSTIVGPPTLCIGFPTGVYSNSTPGGTWSMANGNATIVSTTGVATGVTAGTDIITYVLGAGCSATKSVTIVPAPAAIGGGPFAICQGGTTTLTHSVIGGTWSSSAPGVATIDASGVVTGIMTGSSTAATTTITYTVPSGCVVMAVVTVNPLPSAIGGTLTVCQGGTTTATNSTAGGTWISSDATIASIDITTGLITGIITGSSSVATVTITYTAGTSCAITAVASVNPLPATITGASTVCIGSCVPESSLTSGGVWISSTPSIATASGTGNICGVASGPVTITYVLPTGCQVTKPMTVSAGAGPITGGLGICVAGTTTLSSATGGTWTSSSPGIATVGVSSGLVTGMALGTATIINTMASGCTASVVVTVNSLPAPITGSPAMSVCVGQTTTLNSTPGGTWVSGSPSVGSIGSISGVVTGISGTATTTITYSLGTGCTTSAVVTVNQLPTAISGLLTICDGQTTTLSSSPGSGTWNSSIPSTATIGIGTGIATGGPVASTLTTTISYILAPSGCTATAVLTVNPLPAVITGPTNVCVGSTITLSTTTSGATWVSSNAAVATINPATGVLTGIAAGTVTITCPGPTGCYRTTVITVNGLPTPIGGPSVVCQGSTITVTSTPGGGTWSSSTPATGTISAGGIINGLAPGTTIITYTQGPGSCITTKPVTVNGLPAALTGTLTMCVGQTTTLASTSGGGVWASSNSGVATVGTAGLVTGISGGVGSATATISYTLATGCRTTTAVTVYILPGVITGVPVICQGVTATLGCSPAGGVWSSTNPAAGSISAGGAVTGIITGSAAPATTTISYTLGTGCASTTIETINPIPTAITGSLGLCIGQTTTLGSTPPGNTWSSGNIPVASVSPTTGVVSGATAGTAGITYTLATGCHASAVVTVYALPPAIGGVLNVCVGQTTLLSNTSTGGTWSSSNPAIGTVDVSSGIVTGISASAPGTTTITYTLGTGCTKMADVTVNPLPANITGTMSVCVGQTTSLSNATGGGTWSSSTPSVGTVSGTGVVTGIASGTTTITYTLPTGCITTAAVAVIGLPGTMTGAMAVCKNATTTLSCTPPGGAWSSASPNVSVTGALTGTILGVNAGTATVTYTVGSGCFNLGVVTVNPLPANIGGNLGVCIGFTTALNDATAGGTWSSSAPLTAPIDASGVVSGLVVGNATITYQLTTTGCTITAPVTVNPLPATITGSSGFCNLSSTYMSDASGGGTWTSSNPVIAIIDPVSGLATGQNVGQDTIIYTLPTGCTASKSITIILAPFPIHGDSVLCIGQTTALNNTITGGKWSSNDPTLATIDSVTGVAAGIASGNTTITYKLSLTGCYSTYDVTVNANPTTITGNLSACVGLTSTIMNGLAGGSWSSNDITIATVVNAGPGTGIVTGVAQGTTVLTYQMPGGCKATAVFTVNPLPGPINGSLNICQGSTTTLSDPSSPGGTWSSGAPGIAFVVATTGVVTGSIAPATATITYTLGTGCINTADVSVNPVPQPISGTFGACQNDSAIVTDATPGGVWISSDPTIASVVSIAPGTGQVTGNRAGTVTISYMLVTGCAATTLFTVHGIPAGINGNMTVCAGFATNLTDSTPGGTWSADPAAAGIGSIHHLTGVVTGITPGLVPVTYTLGSGCRVTNTVTVIILPSTITGSPYVCVNSTTTLGSVIGGGTWSSSNTVKATVDAVSGVVSGVSAGTATITYHVGTGCFNVLNVTVNPLPAPVTGTLTVCEQSSTSLASATSGGNWFSDSAAIATIVSATGVATGVRAGTVGITYKLPTGCVSRATLTVNATPAPISGSPYICQSSTVLYSDALSGGVWSSSNPSVATITATGLATPVTLGTSVISYVLPLTGCKATKTITVSPLPLIYHVTGGGTYCSGGNGVHVGLDGSQPGVSYVLYYGSSATGYATGTGLPLDFGLLTPAGIYTVSATYAMSGCIRDMSGSAPVTITPLSPPTVNIGTGTGDSSCPGVPVTLTPMPVNGGTSPTYLWKVNGVNVSTASSYSYVPANGDVVMVTMTSNGSCISMATATGSKTMTVLPSGAPAVGVTADPGDTVCQFSAATFGVSPMYGGPSPQYTWMVNGAVAGTGPTYYYIPVDGDVVSVLMVSNYMCRTRDSGMSANVALTVDSLVVPHVSVYADSGLWLVAGHDLTLHTIVTNAGPTPSYQWKVNGHIIAGATQASYTSGNYHDYDSITCVVTSSGVCKNVASFDWVFLTVIPAGVHQLAVGDADIRIVPNPNRGLFTIKGTLGTAADGELDAEITDMLGQVVYSSKVAVHKGKVDQAIELNNALANGMYLLNLSNDKEHMVFHFVMEQ